jgi:hypothetical protein
MGNLMRTMSISPPRGHAFPLVQKAGQTCWDKSLFCVYTFSGWVLDVRNIHMAYVWRPWSTNCLSDTSLWIRCGSGKHWTPRSKQIEVETYRISFEIEGDIASIVDFDNCVPCIVDIGKVLSRRVGLIEILDVA